MTLLRKLALLWIVLVFAQLQIVQQQADLGRMLCLLKNLPHRGLGMIYAATIQQPERDDWQIAYFAEYAIIRDENRMLEGMTHPTVAFQAITFAKFHPENKAARNVCGLIVQQERDRLWGER